MKQEKEERKDFEERKMVRLKLRKWKVFKCVERVWKIMEERGGKY